jgi:hypothetical protein
MDSATEWANCAQEELSPTNHVERTKREAFDAEIKRRLGNSLAVPKKPIVEAHDPANDFNYDDEVDEGSPDHVVPEADAVDSTGRPINQQSVADLLINAEVLLGHGETQQMARVLRRSMDDNGKVIGNLDGSLKSLVYDVEFPDGAVKQYAANVIAENFPSQVDSSGYHSQFLSHISQHERLGNAVSKKDAYITTKRGVRKMRQTTIGWKFLCNWKDGTSSWASLKVLKESIPIEVA